MLKKSLTTLILIVLVALPLNAAFEAQKAQAVATHEVPTSPLSISAVASAVSNSLTAIATGATAVSTGITAGGVSMLVTKDYSLDVIGWMLINAVLHEMSRSLITWINSGFKGSPAFVQDLEGYMLDVGDKVAGQLIWGSDLKLLCSPFALNVRLALDEQYRRNRSNKGTVSELQCTLSGVVGNVGDFINGNFIAGGWNGWFELTQNPQNNPYGATMIAQMELEKRLANKQAEKTKLLDFGKGFMSMEMCEDVTYDDAGTGYSGEVCSITTPGTAIEAQLNKTLSSGQERLQVADELNEIIAALFSQLVTTAFSGAGGLLGLTKKGYNGSSGTYYDQLAAEGESMYNTAIAASTTSSSITPITSTTGTSGSGATSATGDPGMWTGYWKPEGMTPTVLVADQSGTKGAGNITYFPGCLNQQDPLGSCKSKNTIKAYDMLGAYDLNDKKIASIRYKTGLTLDPDSTFKIDVSNPVGATIPYRDEMGFRMSISEEPGDFSVADTCRGVSYVLLASEQNVSQASQACTLKPNTIYYLNLQAQNGCTFENMNWCKFKISEPSFFAYDPLADTPQNTTATVCGPHDSYSIDSDYQRFFDTGSVHYLSIPPESGLALEFIPGKVNDGDFLLIAKSGATSQFISECPGQITNTCKPSVNFSRTGAPANDFIPACNIGDDRTKTWYFNIYNVSETRTNSIQMKNRRFNSSE